MVVASGLEAAYNGGAAGGTLADSTKVFDMGSFPYVGYVGKMCSDSECCISEMMGRSLALVGPRPSVIIWGSLELAASGR